MNRNLVPAVVGDPAARAQLEQVLDDARSTVRRLLATNRDLVEALRDALLERYELVGEEITSVLDVPISREGRLAGVVCHEHVGAARRWTLAEQQFASAIAHVVLLAYEATNRREAEQALLIA